MIVAAGLTAVFLAAGNLPVYAEKENSNNQILVKYKECVAEEKEEEQIKFEVQTKTNAQKIERTGRTKLDNQTIEAVEVAETDDIDKIVKTFNSDPNVEYAEPNYKMELLEADVGNSPSWGLESIDIASAWSVTKGSPEILVAVIDTGIDISHEKLKNNIYRSTEIENGVDDDGNGFVDDVNGWDFANGDNSVFDEKEGRHGTHVAGIIAADSSGPEMTGVAPMVKILPIKFLDQNKEESGTTYQAIKAIEYAESQGAKIVNCSWGGSGNSKILKDTMEKSKMLFVCAAGNDGADNRKNPNYPAAYDLKNLISVAAYTKEKRLADFSNYGAGIHLAAPGVRIYSTVPGDRYEYLNGTSMAAPFVSGTAALLASISPSMTAREMKEKLLKSAEPVWSAKSAGTSKVLNAGKTLTAEKEQKGADGFLIIGGLLLAAISVTFIFTYKKK